MNVALIGAGRWGRNWARELATRGVLAAIVTNGSPPTLAWLAEHHPAVPLATLDAVLASAVDAVVIATPSASHGAIAAAALGAGKHVLVEKPLTRSLEEFDALTALATGNGRLLASNLTFYRHPCWRWLTAAAQASGGALALRTSWAKWGSFDDDLAWNLGIHDLVLALDLFGDPSGMTVRTTHLTQGIETGVQFHLVWPSGATCFIDLDRASLERRRQVTVTLDYGRAIAWTGEHLVSLDPPAAPDQAIITTVEEPLSMVCDLFLAAASGRHAWDGDVPLLRRATALLAANRP